nr:isoform 2 of f-box protein [Quercus suber]
MLLNAVSSPSRKTSRSRIEQLPDDVLLEIFYRLPCRSAVGCNSVSKRWCSLISHPNFIPHYINHRHQYQYIEPFTLVIQNDDDLVVLPSDNSSSESFEDFGRSGGYGRLVDFLNFLPYRQPYNDLRIEASFNDLLLVSSEVSTNCDYFICNPLTEQWLKLPRLPPTMSIWPVGFICEPFTYSCKVVRIHCPTREANNITLLRVETFSSETGEWSNSFVLSPQGLNPFSLVSKLHRVIACNGMLHWVKVHSEDGTMEGFLVFDPHGGHLRYIRLPVSPQGYVISFGVFQGRLRLFQRSLNLRIPDRELGYRYFSCCASDACNFSVWELEDYADAGTWSLKHKVYFKDMFSECSTVVKMVVRREPVEFIAFHQNDGDIVFLNFGNDILSCNLRTRPVCTLVGSILSSRHKSSAFVLGQPSWPTPVHPLPLKFETPPPPPDC